MDLDGWEILPNSGYLDFHEDDKEKILGGGNQHNPYSKSVFNMNYFDCPSSPPRKSRVVPNQFFPVEIQLGPTTTTTTDTGVITPVVKDPNFGSKEADQDSVSQVFFKKMKENEFVDMKLDSPKSPTKAAGFAPPPPLDAAPFNFVEGKSDALETKINSPRIKKLEMETGEEEEEEEEDVSWEEKSAGFDLWKWSLTGIGAICSFGVAAATVCIIILGSNQANKHQQQKFRFQIYNDDKRIKEVVQYSAKLNEAISAVRGGVPIHRAQISYGGYYDHSL